MKALSLLVPLALVLGGCTTYRVSYVDPPRTVVAVPAPAVIAASPLADIDGDGVPDISDRMPYDSRFR